MAQISLFIGGIRPLPQSGRPTGIYKKPVTQAVAIGEEGFIGDQQADRRVHGGPEKAVHLFPARHYAPLAKAFPDAAELLVPGSMGENLSTAELDENMVRIGDVWQLGNARLQVCQPRNPCWKIDERFACDGMAAHIAEHRLNGWYWRVLTPGTVHPGEEFRLETQADTALTLADALQLWQTHRPDIDALEALANTPGLADQWRQKMLIRLAWLHKNAGQPSPVTTFHVKPPENLAS